MMKLSLLQPTSWLAKRLGVSVSTIERLRSHGSFDLPPSITIGGSIRYDNLIVEEWIRDRMKLPVAPQTSNSNPVTEREGETHGCENQV